MLEHTEDFLPYGVCRICHRFITSKGQAFCDEHLQHYEQRQREGVTTEDLSALWEDTLSTWRERPPALEGELEPRANATPLAFADREGDWLLFRRSYVLDFPRDDDYLAINTQTGAIRRFVHVTLADVLEDLQGGRPAAFQADLAPFWGKEELTGLQLPYRLRPQPDLSALVYAAPFQVYGLVGQPFGLTLCGMSCGGSQGVRHRPTSIGFVFSSPRYPGTRENFNLSSANPKQQGLALSKNTVQALQLDASIQLLGAAGSAESAREQAGTVSLRQGYATLEGRRFLGQIRHWAHPRSLDQHTQGEGVFYLEGEETIMSGGSWGPTEEELLHLLASLVVL
ncbi:MAG TPA: hypothetical protein VFU32_15235, partial [Ktedonobacterales bacterium]|nr:hypothetical protein [Ktedonobacterales bacterium]